MDKCVSYNLSLNKQRINPVLHTSIRAVQDTAEKVWCIHLVQHTTSTVLATKQDGT